MKDINCIEIDLDRRSRYVRACLEDCNRMHRAVQALFDCARQHGDVLYRTLDGDLKIRTDRFLKGRGLPDGFTVRNVTELDVPAAGRVMRFRLACAPRNSKDGKKHFLKKEEERAAWLDRKLAEAGVQLLTLDEQGLFRVHGSRKHREITMGAASYTGTLQITDRELLETALRTGIGAGKAYGLGMLILSREVC